MTDAQLAVLSQRGDRQAFGCLVRRWDGRLFRFLLRLLGNEEEARDACQDALLRAYLNIGKLRRPENFKAWIHQIALNLCRDRNRSTKGRTVVALHEAAGDGGEGQEMTATQATPLEQAEQADLAAVLRRVLADLPLEQRTAILLRELQGFTAAEIARTTGVPAATVRSRIFYGLKAMRRMLPEHGVTAAHLNEGV